MAEANKRISLIKRFVTEIKEKIVQGEYAEGQLLPPQEEMAKSFGISRATLREATNQLSTLGLIDVVHGVGCYVRRPNASEFFNNFSSIVVMDSDSAEELLQARFVIEPSVTAMAAQNATDKEIADIYQLLTRMEDDYRTGFPQKAGAKDSEFHMLIAKSAHNQILMPVVHAIRELLPNSIHQAFWQTKKLVDSAMEYHRKIYEAIVARDPDTARQYMDEHLATVRDLHIKLLG